VYTCTHAADSLIEVCPATTVYVSDLEAGREKAAGRIFGASSELLFRASISELLFGATIPSFYFGASLRRLTLEEPQLAMFILIFYFMMLFMLLLFMVNC